MEKRTYQLGDRLRIKVGAQEFRVMLTFLKGERAGLFTYPTGYSTTDAVFGDFRIPIFRKGTLVTEEALKNYVRASGLTEEEGGISAEITIEEDN